MIPEERCYTILQESKYIRILEENPNEKIQYFLDSAKGCTWEYPSTKIQERQFETSLKGWFSQFYQELIEFAKSTESTIDDKTKPFNDGYRGMDDQGFEGVIIKDGSFYRNIQDELIYEFYKILNEELESQWQTQTEIIKTSLLQAYKDSTTTEESETWLQKAKQAQNRQSTIQAEITRRAK